MLQYVDSFSCSWNQKSGNVVINFMQKEPDFDAVAESEQVPEKTNSVASIIMDKEAASALLNILQEACEKIQHQQIDDKNK